MPQTFSLILYIITNSDNDFQNEIKLKTIFKVEIQKPILANYTENLNWLRVYAIIRIQ